jgi:thymidylate synthase ThyX
VALRHFFRLRCAKAAHPQIRSLALALLELMMWSGLAVLFQDQIDEFLIFPKGPANE